MVGRASRRVAVAAAAMVFMFGIGSPAGASHAWANYHWARTSNPFTLSLGDNVSGSWDDVLATSSADWSTSDVLDTKIVAGSTSVKRCGAVSGTVQVCNAKYGRNGWLGVAQVWVSGSHIVQGTVRLNDTYFATSTYNKPDWRNFVMCQEVGHTLGLTHQDEIFNNANLGSCMDYTSSPSSNQHPNAHDFEQLESIYSHLDTTTSLASGASGSASGRADGAGEWGRRVHGSEASRSMAFERDLGGGLQLLTFVILA